MDGLRITVDDPGGEAVAQLIAWHLAEMRRWTPPEKVHALPGERLAESDVTFFSARLGDALAGIGALKQLAPDHGEIKSMRVAPEYLGRGVGEAILVHLIAEARRRGYARLSLETGRSEAFRPAQALYAKHGFAPCPAFADYVIDDFSQCLDKTL